MRRGLLLNQYLTMRLQLLSHVASLVFEMVGGLLRVLAIAVRIRAHVRGHVPGRHVLYPLAVRGHIGALVLAKGYI